MMELVGRREYFFHASFGAYLVVRRFDATSEEREKALRPDQAEWFARDWLRDQLVRPTLLRIFDDTFGSSLWSGDGQTGYSRERIYESRLTEAFRKGDLLMLQVRGLPSVGAPEASADEASLGAPLEAKRTDFIEVMLFDSLGQLMPSDIDAQTVRFNVRLADNRELPGGLPQAWTLLAARAVTGIEGDPPSACTVMFFDELSDIVPTDLTAPSDPQPPDPRKLATALGPINGPTLVSRRTLASTPQTASLDSTNVFQLQRREAEVIELEHFNPGGAIFLPGDAPPDVYRPGVLRPKGIDVLRECLDFAQGCSANEIVITGHDALVSQERADCVRLLLVGDLGARHDWIALASANATSDDHDAILSWAAAFFGALEPGSQWAACSPSPDEPRDGSPRPSVEAFQRAYNADVLAGCFPTAPVLPSGDQQTIRPSGVVGVDTYGAMFDCYIRGLRPAPPPPPGPQLDPALAGLDVGPPATRTGRNSGRPTGVYAFVVLGTNGPGNAPITIAKVGGGRSENDYVLMEPLNPQYHFGVDPEFIGQALNVPTAWVSNLLAAGYTVQRDDVQPSTAPPAGPPTPDAPPPLPTPGPSAVGCGPRHLTTPFARAPARRGKNRAVEAMFLDESARPIVCTVDAPNPCVAATCELYDPREYDLDYVGIGNHFDVFFDARVNFGDDQEAYRLVARDGSYDRTLSRGEARPHGHRLALRFTDVPAEPLYDFVQILVPSVVFMIHTGFRVHAERPR